MGLKVLVFGEVLWDLFPDGKYLGGAPLNFGAHLAQLGEDVRPVSAVGGDALGTEALHKLEEMGLNREAIAVLKDMPTGRCIVTLDAEGSPQYDLWEQVAYDRIPCPKNFKDYDTLYFGTLALRSQENLQTLRSLLNRRAIRQVFVDLNLRPPFVSQEAVDFALRAADFLKLSLEECPLTAQVLGWEHRGYASLAQTLKENYSNIKCILVTLGGEGAWGWEIPTGRQILCPGEKVCVRSTVGAGDSFCAGFLHRYEAGADFSECLKFGVSLSAYVVSQTEAIPSLPSLF